MASCNGDDGLGAKEGISSLGHRMGPVLSNQRKGVDH